MTKFCHKLRIFFEILLHQTEIRMHLQFSDGFGTKRTSVWFQIHRKIVNTIWFRFDSVRFPKNVSVCGRICLAAALSWICLIICRQSAEFSSLCFFPFVFLFFQEFLALDFLPHSLSNWIKCDLVGNFLSKFTSGSRVLVPLFFLLCFPLFLRNF